MVACSDRQNMKQIRLLLGDKWVEIQPTDYLNPGYVNIGTVTGASTGACRVCIKQSEDNFWHVGTSLLVGYYAEFDFNSRTLGLQPLASGTKISIEKGFAPARDIGASWWKITFLIFCNLAVIYTLVVLFLAVYTSNNYFPATLNFLISVKDTIVNWFLEINPLYNPPPAASIQSGKKIALSEVEQLLEQTIEKRRSIEASTTIIIDTD